MRAAPAGRAEGISARKSGPAGHSGTFRNFSMSETWARFPGRGFLYTSSVVYDQCSTSVRLNQIRWQCAVRWDGAGFGPSTGFQVTAQDRTGIHRRRHRERRVGKEVVFKTVAATCTAACAGRNAAFQVTAGYRTKIHHRERREHRGKKETGFSTRRPSSDYTGPWGQLPTPRNGPGRGITLLRVNGFLGRYSLGFFAVYGIAHEGRYPDHLE